MGWRKIVLSRRYLGKWAYSGRLPPTCYYCGLLFVEHDEVWRHSRNGGAISGAVNKHACQPCYDSLWIDLP